MQRHKGVQAIKPDEFNRLTTALEQLSDHEIAALLTTLIELSARRNKETQSHFIARLFAILETQRISNNLRQRLN